MIFFLGSESNIGKVLIKKLECSTNEYMHFISTMAAASGYRLSAKHMFMSGSIIRTEGLLSEKKYKEFWRKIGKERVQNKTAAYVLGEKPL